jgi:hypothetical protein
MAARAGVHRFSLQPRAQHLVAMERAGAEIGEALIEVGYAHGARMLPPRLYRHHARDQPDWSL